MATAAGAASGARIATRQNDAWNIALLAAQRYTYTDLKLWRRFRVWLTVSVTVAGLLAAAMAGVVAPEWLKPVGLLAAAVSITQWVISSYIEKQRAKMAATIQEQFDAAVLQLPWNSTLGNKVDTEDIIRASDRFEGSRADLADWYSVPADAPPPLDVLLCQRANLRYDSSLRKAYSRHIGLQMCGFGALLLALEVWRGLPVLDLVFSLLPAVGAFLAGLDTTIAHRRHAADQINAQRMVESLWERARKSRRAVKLGDLRQLQDRIFMLRASAPPVPDSFYKRQRQQHEREMRAASDRLWNEPKGEHRGP